MRWKTSWKHQSITTRARECVLFHTLAAVVVGGSLDPLFSCRPHYYRDFHFHWHRAYFKEPAKGEGGKDHHHHHRLLVYQTSTGTSNSTNGTIIIITTTYALSRGRCCTARGLLLMLLQTTLASTAELATDSSQHPTLCNGARSTCIHPPRTTIIQRMTRGKLYADYFFR